MCFLGGPGTHRGPAGARPGRGAAAPAPPCARTVCSISLHWPSSAAACPLTASHARLNDASAAACSSGSANAALAREARREATSSCASVAVGREAGSRASAASRRWQAAVKLASMWSACTGGWVGR